VAHEVCEPIRQQLLDNHLCFGIPSLVRDSKGGELAEKIFDGLGTLAALPYEGFLCRIAARLSSQGEVKVITPFYQSFEVSLIPI
jgi:hypothetical protein